MSALNRILRGSGPAGRKRGLAKVVFVSYGPFDCNSAGHIAGFAGELARLGFAVGVCARDNVWDAYAFGPAAFEPFTLKALGEDPAGVIGFDGRLEPERTMLVCWTPRKLVRQTTAKVLKRLALPYIVHFEDNEEHLSALRHADDGEAAARDVDDRRAFLDGAAGATLIEPRLQEIMPARLNTLVLEPGVDHELFAAPLPPHRRSSLLRAAGAPPDARVLVYTGNIHRANLPEMAELYRAVRLLRDRGRPVVLLKTGKDDVPVAEALGFDPGDHGVIALGQIARSMLVDLVKCADLFVQPGAPGPFNDYRLPSKLPEVMAVGRPVALPATNLGLRLKDGEEALLLREGTAAEIAAKVEQILDDPALAARLSAGAQAYARRTWRWERQGRLLADFLEQCSAVER